MWRSRVSFWLLIGWVAGLISSGGIAAALAGWIVIGGRYNTGANSPHKEIVAWALHTTMIHSVRKRAEDIHPPESFTSAEIAAGAAEYKRHCVSCHGGPGVARAPWTSALLPTPPFLIDASRHWTPAQLYKIVHDGVKMTAMPAWGEIEPDETIWDIVAFLITLPSLSPREFERDVSEARTAAQDGAVGGQTASGAPTSPRDPDGDAGPDIARQR
jgi:mono/diheme cytochrome c family protein